MNALGHVNVEVAVALHHHLAASFDHAVWFQALALDFEQTHFATRCIQPNDVQGECFGVASTWVGVELGIDQLRNGGYTIAHDVSGFTTGGGHHAVAHHQDTVLVAAHKAFDQHLDLAGAAPGRANAVGRLPSSAHACFVGHIQRHAAPTVAIDRFDGHGQADVLGGFPSRVRRGDDLTFGHGNAALGQQFFGQVFVAGNALGDGAGAIGFSRPDASLLGAIAQLHQVAFGQTDERCFAFNRSVHDGGGAGAQTAAIDDVFEFFNGGRQVKGQVVGRAHHQAVCGCKTGTAQLFVFGAKDDLVDTAFADFAGFAEFSARTRQQLQLDRGVLDDVSHPSAANQAGQKTAAMTHAAVVLDQAGQPGVEAVIEAVNFVGRVVLHFAQIDQSLDDGAIGPDVGPSQIVDTQNLDIFEGHKSVQMGSTS